LWTAALRVLGDILPRSSTTTTTIAAAAAATLAAAAAATLATAALTLATAAITSTLATRPHPRPRNRLPHGPHGHRLCRHCAD